jgi:hypothetical protein
MFEVDRRFGRAKYVTSAGAQFLALGTWRDDEAARPFAGTTNGRAVSPLA